MDVGAQAVRGGLSQKLALGYRVAHGLDRHGGLADVLLERDEYRLRLQGDAGVGVQAVVGRQAQPGHQPVGGRLALVHKLPGVGLHVPGHLNAALAQLALDVAVHLAGRQAHGAGEHLAHAAVAAVGRVAEGAQILLVVLDAPLPPQVAHDQVGADLVPDEIAGAEIGTHAALDAGALGLMADGLHRELGPPEQVVLLGQDDQVSGGLSDHGRLNGGPVGEGLAHHGSAHDEGVVR